MDSKSSKPFVSETEGAGSILEKLLVSMKGTSHDDPTVDTPLGQFLTNGATIARQEEQVSAKLDKLNDIAIPSSVSAEPCSKPHDADSIVHLLNSKEYSLPLPDPAGEEEEEFSYYPGMSPPVTLTIPEPEPEEEKPIPVVEEPLPYSRPVPDTIIPETTPETPSPLKAEKKTINLQTYLKRKKDDDLVEPPRTDSPEEPTLPPTPVKTPRETDVDDLLEWASQDTDAIGEDEEEKSPEKMETEKTEEGEEEEVIPEPEKEQEDVKEAEKVDDSLDAIRSPSTSPVDSLLEEKLASPSVAPPSPPPPPLANMEEGEISEEEKKKQSKSLSPTRSEGMKPSRSRSVSKTKKDIKKDKKKKKKNKKKRDKDVDTDLEEDIRKLEFLKAELEREERREKKEKEKKKEGKDRKRSPSPRAVKDKRKKEKRQKR